MKTEADDEPHWRELGRQGRLAGRPLRFLPETDSTNQVALELAAAGEERVLVVAESQRRGRGRLARSWHSPPGAGIYLSLLYRPRLAPADLAKLTLAAGLAVCRALEKTTGARPGLKWPNDVLLEGKKCGGILCECRLAQDDDEAAAVVIGIGLNVNTEAAHIPPELRERATSLLLATGRRWDRGLLLPALVEELDALVAELEAGRFPAILAAWRRRDALLGRELDWLTPAGEVVRGIALGPDAAGILHIRDAQGRIHEVISGDVTPP
jgi:BirA family transcriptional regulator, biotin operon repressor / biotin---[acetyl-CoA-carboxylase] ligase